MNEKIKAILLKLVIALKKQRWILDKDYEVTLHGENYILLHKKIEVDSSSGDQPWNNSISTSIKLIFESDDRVTYYPKYIVMGEIFIQGGGFKDIEFPMEAGIGFTENDLQNNEKIQTVANTINYHVENYIQEEYDDYVDSNFDDIQNYNKGGWKADDDAHTDR